MAGFRHDGAAMRTALAVTGLVVVLSATTSTARGHDVRTFFAQTLSLDAAELDRLDTGEVVTRTLPASDTREVATVGIVRMRMTPDFYVSRLVDIVNFKRADAVLQIGVFGSPPAASDVATLTLDASDLRNLRDCRVGHCGVQLPAEAIERFQREVNWLRADASTRANALMQGFLADYVSQYQQAGASASMRYADETSTLDTAQEFGSLVQSDLGEWDRFPALRSHLLQYPASSPPETRDVLYWSKEKVGRRSVASITHLAIARTAGESPAEYAIASKQIYGTHYYDASLGLTMLVPDRTSATPVTYVAYVNRSRVDVFRGVLGAFTRKIVTMKARTTVSEQLSGLQRTLESQFESISTPR